jgi:hypothetical protein
MNANKNTLIEQYTTLIKQLVKTISDINSLRLQLDEKVRVVNDDLQNQLKRKIRPQTSYYWVFFYEYWQSFSLFQLKMEILLKQLSIPVDLDDDFPESLDRIDESLWEDTIDDIDETIYQLRLRRDKRRLLLMAIELLDSAERLCLIKVPILKGKNKAEKFTQALQHMQKSTTDIMDNLTDLLKEYGVSKLDLSVGQYPPPEKTRVISRNDNNADDNVVIVQIILNGYKCDEQILRKADVIVTSNKGV